jgi:hypothetical protein
LRWIPQPYADAGEYTIYVANPQNEPLKNDANPLALLQHMIAADKPTFDMDGCVPKNYRYPGDDAHMAALAAKDGEKAKMLEETLRPVAHPLLIDDSPRYLLLTL